MGLREKLNVLIAAARGDSGARYVLAERASFALHPEAVLSDHSRSWLDDHEFESTYRRFHRDGYRRTMDRVYFADQLSQLAKEIPGQTAECGVYEGLTSYVICDRTQPGKRHHAFDSFAGLSNPGELDGEYWSSGDLSVTEQVFRENLKDFDVEVHAGWIPERFDDVADECFSLLHVDVDLFEPTRDSVEFFYDRMSPMGIMLFDDYGLETCPGARRAVDEFFADRPEHVLHVPTGQGLVFKGLPSSAGGP